MRSFHRAALFGVIALFTACRAPELTLEPGETSVRAGLKVRLNAALVDGSPLPDGATWTSSHPAVAAVVDASGVILGKAPGETKITVTLGEQEASAYVRVLPAGVVSVSVSPATTRSLPVGIAMAATAEALYTDGSTADVTKDVAWSSSDEAIAAIAAGGEVRGKKQGEAVLTATIEGWAPGEDGFGGEERTVSGTATVTVTDALLKSLEISPAHPRIPLGLTEELKAVGHFSDDSKREITTQVRWTSSDRAVASVDNEANKGLVRTFSLGQATVRAELGDIAAQTTVEVTVAKLQAVSLAQTSLTLPVGTALELEPRGVYSDATTRALDELVSWTSDDETVAMVAAGNELKGLKVGTTRIHASFDGVKSSFEVTVTQAVRTG
ncbi:MAG: Ig-like domain-containing protein, partial [Myxococcales bacterium]